RGDRTHRHDRQRHRAASPLRDPHRWRQREPDRSVPDAQKRGLLSRRTGHAPPARASWYREPTTSSTVSEGTARVGMADAHSRSARVLEPVYVDDLDANSIDELRAKHAECVELETEVSYVRRLTQARIDILEAEVQRRSSGGSLEDLINRLPEILADPGPRGDPASSRLPLQIAPDQASEWPPAPHP